MCRGMCRGRQGQEESKSCGTGGGRRPPRSKGFEASKGGHADLQPDFHFGDHGIGHGAHSFVALRGVAGSGTTQILLRGIVEHMGTLAAGFRCMLV